MSKCTLEFALCTALHYKLYCVNDVRAHRKNCLLLPLQHVHFVVVDDIVCIIYTLL